MSKDPETRNKADADDTSASKPSASAGTLCDQAPVLAITAQAAKTTAPASLKSNNFYGSNRLLLIDQRIARLRTDAQRRLQGTENAPFERFALQRQAFAWAQAQELAANLK